MSALAGFSGPSTAESQSEALARTTAKSTALERAKEMKKAIPSHSFLTDLQALFLGIALISALGGLGYQIRCHPKLISNEAGMNICKALN